MSIYSSQYFHSETILRSDTPLNLNRSLKNRSVVSDFGLLLRHDPLGPPFIGAWLLVRPLYLAPPKA